MAKKSGSVVSENAPSDGGKGWCGPDALRPLLVPIESLSPDPSNARRHNDRNIEAIIASLHRFGQRFPIVVQKQGMIVRAGNGRIEAMKRLGWKNVAAVVVDESSVDATAFAIADNRTAELAEWDDETLASLLQSMDGAEREVAGFTEAELGELLEKLTPDVEVSEDEVPEPPPDPITKTGDLWLLGEHRLLCGDSTKADDVARLMGGEKADLCVTSPPYNCGIDYDQHDDTMKSEAYLDFIKHIVLRVFEVLSDGRFVAWNVGVSPKSKHFAHATILGDRFAFWRQIVWAKSGVAFPTWQFTIDSGLARKYHPNYTHEVIYLFTKGEPVVGLACNVDDEYSKDVWHVHQSGATKDIPGTTDGRRPRTDSHGGAKAAAHPAAYPVGIPAGAIKHLTSSGEIVYEPFCGSGTTLIAAEQLGRKCYGMEISPQYCDVIVKRWETLTGRKAELVKQ